MLNTYIYLNKIYERCFYMRVMLVMLGALIPTAETFTRYNPYEVLSRIYCFRKHCVARELYSGPSHIVHVENYGRLSEKLQGAKSAEGVTTMVGLAIHNTSYALRRDGASEETIQRVDTSRKTLLNRVLPHKTVEQIVWAQRVQHGK